jgi:hypothetical protein
MRRKGWSIEFDGGVVLALCIGVALIVMAIRGGS